MWGPGIAESLTRRPVSHPLAEGPQLPLVRGALGTWFAIFVMGERVHTQMRADRAVPPQPFAQVLAFHDQQARLEARSIAVNQAERDEQTLLQGRAEAANDLGTIQGLLPLQAYRYAAGVPPKQL